MTKDVDAYWTKEFKDSGLPEPRVSYDWIPAGQTAASACGDDDGTLGDSAAAYCPGDDTIYISQKFATDIYNGALDQALPGSSQGYGQTVGDFSVAYIVAHEYGHEVQDELGLFDQYGRQLPTMAFELQADCYAGTWAKSAYEREPPRGRRRAGGAGRRARRRRLRHRATPATTARPSSARRHGTAASRRATRRPAAPTSTRRTSATAGRREQDADAQAQDPSYPGDGTGYGLRGSRPPTSTAASPRSAASGRPRTHPGPSPPVDGGGGRRSPRGTCKA